MIQIGKYKWYLCPSCEGLVKNGAVVDIWFVAWLHSPDTIDVSLTTTSKYASELVRMYEWEKIKVYCVVYADEDYHTMRAEGLEAIKHFMDDIDD